MQRIGPYRVIRTIGVGGMGEVSLCALERAGGFEKRVAVKRARPDRVGDPAQLALFEREARLAALLDHRHIVQIFDFGHDADGAWLAMEFVHGVDLKAVLDGDAPLPLGLAVEIGVACARGLAYAHRAVDPRGRPLGIVHRDVSPHNVLLSLQGDVKLGDFGVALATARSTGPAGTSGKLAYMSPEQARGEAADARSDLFALGVVLYELLCGQRCFFDGGDAAALQARVRAGAPRAPLAAAAPSLPAALVAVVAQAMAPDPADRFSDGEALADALLAAALAAGVRVGQPPLGPWLQAHFPDRAAAIGPAAGDGTHTAAASAPIEATATAAAPIQEPTPSSGSPGPTAPPHAPAAAPPSPPVSAPPTVTGRRRGGWGLAAVGLVGVAAWALWPDGPAPVAPDGGPAAGARRSQDLGAAVTPTDARSPEAEVPEAGLPDAGAPADAAGPDAAPADAAPALPPDAGRPRRPPAGRPRRADAGVRRPASVAPTAPASAPPSAAPPSAPPSAAPPSAPPSAAPASAPPSDAAIPAGPRMRLGPGARVLGPHTRHGPWVALPGAGLLVEAQGADGPKVRVRLMPRGGRVLATVASTPFGQLTVDDRALGGTPAAMVPLHAGAHTLTVATEAGGATTLTLTVSP